VKHAALHQCARQLHIVGIDVGLLGERDIRRLFVGALAETNANAFRQQVVDVLFAAVEIRLDNGANASRVSGSMVRCV
jgi:hypothetical protein